MTRVDLRHIPLKATERFPRLRKAPRLAVLGAFVLVCALVCADLCVPASLFRHSRSPEAVLLALAIAATLLAMTRELPGQNVLLAALLIVMAVGGVESLNSLAGLPFGPCVFGERIGRLLFYVVPWPVPLIWLAALLTCRGVARLVLRPWRRGRNYGWWLIALTVLLTVLFDFGLQPFAIKVEHYWSWRALKLFTDWYGAPWVSFLGRGVTMLILLAFVTPALINKRPVAQPPDYFPLLVWLALNALFFTGAIAHHLWATAVLGGLGALTTTVFAVRGSRAEPPGLRSSLS